MAVFFAVMGTGYGQVEKPADVRVASSLNVVLAPSGHSLMERQEAVGKVGANLADDEFGALVQFLARTPQEDSLAPDELNALKNEVINALKNQKRDPNPLINQLIVLYREPGQDEVLRDYCIQHLGTLYPAGTVTNRESVRQLFSEATDVKRGSIAGTALIAIANNRGADIISQSIADKAIAIAEDAAYGEAPRITALQIGAKLNDARVLPVAREIAFGGSGVPLRVSAIAAIGTMGDESDLAKLEPLANSTDIRLRTAATAAVKKLGKHASRR
jgi:hypothetical protein